jgi:hypothetical protein
MGFYDLGGALTGLSLKGQKCDVILSRSMHGRLVPIWGAITGEYNRLGAIDDPSACRHELEHLSRAYSAHVSNARLEHRGDSVQPDDPFFERFETNRHRVTLDGDRLHVVLIHHRIAEHLVAEEEAHSVSVEQLFRKTFADTEVFAPFIPDELRESDAVECNSAPTWKAADTTQRIRSSARPRGNRAVHSRRAEACANAASTLSIKPSRTIGFTACCSAFG